MIIAGNDRDEQTIRGGEVADTTKIITYHAREYLPCSSAMEGSRGISVFSFSFFFILFFYAQEEEYAALITGQRLELGALRKYQSAPPQR